MSDAAVNREGLEGVRPDTEARTWSQGDGGRRHRRREPPADGPRSYYGDPIINPPVWGELDIAGYLFAGGLAGASSLVAAGAELSGRPVLARRSKLCATAAIGASLIALVHDLGRPARFLNMLRVFKPSSPMSVSVWILVAYAPATAAAAVSDLSGRAPRAGRAAAVGAGTLGVGVATYTGALLANTAVPTWHEGRRELPFKFAGSAAAAAAGAGLIAAPLAENGPVRRLAALGALGEAAADQLMERRIGIAAEPLHEGQAGRRMRAAKVLTAVGALGASTLGGRSRGAAVASGAALVAGSVLTRFGVFAAGMQSARDPRYTVEPQRDRRRASLRPS